MKALNYKTDSGFVVRQRKQVGSFMFHCHRQPLKGHRTAKARCVGENLRMKQLPVGSLPFKTVSSKRQ